MSARNLLYTDPASTSAPTIPTASKTNRCKRLSLPPSSSPMPAGVTVLVGEGMAVIVAVLVLVGGPTRSLAVDASPSVGTGVGGAVTQMSNRCPTRITVESKGMPFSSLILSMLTS